VTRRIASGTPWEPVAGYSRAVAAGDYVFVAGCTSPGTGAYEQARGACAAVLAALERAGAAAADLVQTRMYVTDITCWEQVGRAHAEAFGAAPPAAAMVEVSRLIKPEMLVEVEAVAFVG